MNLEELIDAMIALGATIGNKTAFCGQDEYDLDYDGAEYIFTVNPDGRVRFDEELEAFETDDYDRALEYLKK